jgi:hypothetical protein
MKLPNEGTRSASMQQLNADHDSVLMSYISGNSLHPARRAADTCPLSRRTLSTAYPPTSPKMHELRERDANQPAAD